MKEVTKSWKRQENNLSPIASRKPSVEGMQVCPHLAFIPERPVLDFYLPEPEDSKWVLF